MTAGNPDQVGWCHACGTVQLKRDMPEHAYDHTDAAEPCCVVCLDEPWGLGVWDKGEHGGDCAWVAAARDRTVDWTPTFQCRCTTPTAGHGN